MELDALKTSWQKSGTTLLINEEVLEKIQQQKHVSNLRSFLISRYLVVTMHVVAIILLLYYLAHHSQPWPYFMSGLVLVSFYIFLFLHGGVQIYSIHRFNTSNLLNAQTIWSEVQSHQLLFLKLSVLYIPALLCYPVVVPEILRDLNLTSWPDFDILKASNGQWWKVQIISWILFIPMGIWFFLQISPNNLDKKWVNKLIKRTMNASVIKSVEYLQELKTTINQ